MVLFDFPIIASALSFDDIERAAKEAETLGYYMIGIDDHFLTSDSSLFEQWVTLAALAAATHTLKVGTLETNSNFRTPALLAKLGATLDYLSKDRLVLGIAAGGNNPAKYESSGFDYLQPRERIEKVTEIIRITKLRWTRDSRPRPSSQNPHQVYQQIIAGIGKKRYAHSCRDHPRFDPGRSGRYPDQCHPHAQRAQSRSISGP